MPIADRSALQCVNEFLQAITGKDATLGGKIFFGICGLRKTAPIIHFADTTETITASMVLFPLWASFAMLHLDQPIHNASDPTYAQCDDEIGQGYVTRDETNISFDLIPNVDNI